MLVNVWTGTQHASDIAIRASRVVAIRSGFDGTARKTIDCSGRFVLPGRIAAPPAIAGLNGPALLAAGITSLLVPAGGAGEAAGLSLRVWEIVSLQADFVAAEIGTMVGTARQTQPMAHTADPHEAAALLRDGTTLLASDSGILTALTDAGLDSRRQALALPVGAAPPGVSPVQFAQWAGFNLAISFALDHEVGSVAPGRRADLLICENAFGPPVGLVLDGRLFPLNRTLPTP
jgi:hypothetical protein